MIKKSDRIDFKKVSDIHNIVDSIKKMEGKNVAVLCARYQYRGLLKYVDETHMILLDPCAVEVSGMTDRKICKDEDPIYTPLIIKMDAVEIVYQPLWCFAPLPSDTAYDAFRDKYEKEYGWDHY